MAGPITQHFEKNRTQSMSFLMMMKSLQEELEVSAESLKQKKRRKRTLDVLKFWKRDQ